MHALTWIGKLVTVLLYPKALVYLTRKFLYTYQTQYFIHIWFKHRGKHKILEIFVCYESF
jgi:hypothetical protein